VSYDGSTTTSQALLEAAVLASLASLPRGDTAYLYDGNEHALDPTASAADASVASVTLAATLRSCAWVLYDRGGARRARQLLRLRRLAP
jgi:hypothetical protein